MSDGSHVERRQRETMKDVVGGVDGRGNRTSDRKVETDAGRGMERRHSSKK